MQADVGVAKLPSPWNTAAALAVNDITKPSCTQADASSLSAYLAKHAASAVFQSINISSSCRPRIELVLPMLHLTTLHSLSLNSIQVTRAPADAAAAAGPYCSILEPALTALTRLELHNCQVLLHGLPEHTGLQHLAVVAAEDSPADHNASNTEVLVEALPRLLQLASLWLGGAVCQDAVLTHISRLKRLQDLQLQQCECTASSFASLPQSLTRLCLGCEFGAAEPVLVLSPSSTPGLCQQQHCRSL